MRSSLSMRRVLVTGTALAAIACGGSGSAFAQSTPQEVDEAIAQDVEAGESGPDILVTGSRIRRDPNDSSLPLQIVTTQELQRNSISSAEQLLSFLTTNGTGLDNLASNADVVGGAQRGNNGASFANLRGQGSGATLVLLNGRRVAAHGLNGAAVDVNQIPFAAIERVEVLKDGASAIYGTDAIGGVINFITRTDYEGIGASAFTDITERGDAPIYRVSGIAGYGDLAADGFNVMGAVSYSDAGLLRGSERDFVNTFQPNRGLSVDTRGTPHATILGLAGTFFPDTASFPFVPGTTIRTNGGINVLDLPGAEGCDSFDGQDAYDEDLWAFPQAEFACAWDTGRAAALQQPLQTLTYLGRGVVRLGAHEVFVELTGSDATATKSFSNLQITPNSSTQRYEHPVGGVNYDVIYNRLIAAFPGLAGRPRDGFAYRWRCIECGPREITTDTKTFRAAGGIEGPVAAGWDYRAGISYAQSESESTLGGGYYFRGTLGSGADDPNAPLAAGTNRRGIIGLLNSGILNPFLLPGQTQSQAALDALDSVSAEGVVLYGGKYSVTQIDASVAGPLFRLPGGSVQAAIGVDYRREEYGFNGDARAAAARPVIIAAPFDDGNALEGVSRDIKAAYAEILVPLFDSLEITGAVRIDEYEGFGSTTNPKVSIKFRPIDAILFRGSYNTGFRAPTFNQIFNDQAEALFTGRDLADPQDCAGGIPVASDPNCQAIQPNIIAGGNPDLGPETAEQFTAGIVFQPSNNFSASLDFWRINRENTIQNLSLRQLVNNFPQFMDRFIRDGAGNIVTIDQTIANAGSTRTQGLELSVRGSAEIMGGLIAAGLDGTYLLKKEERIAEGVPFDDQIGVFSFAGDLGLRWKHNAFISYSTGGLNVALSQIFRSGYTNQELPGVANGTITPPDLVERVDDYITYNLSVGYAVNEQFKITAGVKNLFDTDPPFAITYDSNFGSGSSWEPRVADPRGRAFTMLAEVKF